MTYYVNENWKWRRNKKRRNCVKVRKTRKKRKKKKKKETWGRRGEIVENQEGKKKEKRFREHKTWSRNCSTPWQFRTRHRNWKYGCVKRLIRLTDEWLTDERQNYSLANENLKISIDWLNVCNLLNLLPYSNLHRKKLIHHLKNEFKFKIFVKNKEPIFSPQSFKKLI